MTKFRNGAIVRHRSGSIDMLVIYQTAGKRHVGCEWHTQNGIRSDSIAIDHLELVRPAPPFDIAPFEGQSMPDRWKREVRYEEKIALIHFRLGREFERLCYLDHEFMRFA